MHVILKCETNVRYEPNELCVANGCLNTIPCDMEQRKKADEMVEERKKIHAKIDVNFQPNCKNTTQ